MIVVSAIILSPRLQHQEDAVSALIARSTVSPKSTVTATVFYPRRGSMSGNVVAIGKYKRLHRTSLRLGESGSAMTIFRASRPDQEKSRLPPFESILQIWSDGMVM